MRDPVTTEVVCNPKLRTNLKANHNNIDWLIKQYEVVCNPKLRTNLKANHNNQQELLKRGIVVCNPKLRTNLKANHNGVVRMFLNPQLYVTLS